MLPKSVGHIKQIIIAVLHTGGRNRSAPEKFAEWARSHADAQVKRRTKACEIR